MSPPPFSLLPLLLLIAISLSSSIFFTASEARPLFSVLSLEGVKNSGPSPGGDGHRSINPESLAEIKESGPSPGDGHASPTAESKREAEKSGGIHVAGPSPGDGHKYTNIGKTLGGIKDSGPSPGGGHNSPLNAHGLNPVNSGGIHVNGPSPGDGHKFTNIGKTLGGIKDSGPSPGGDGHRFETTIGNLGGIKDSGPSPGGGGHGHITDNVHIGGVKAGRSGLPVGGIVNYYTRIQVLGGPSPGDNH